MFNVLVAPTAECYTEIYRGSVGLVPLDNEEEELVALCQGQSALLALNTRGEPTLVVGKGGNGAPPRLVHRRDASKMAGFLLKRGDSRENTTTGQEGISLAPRASAVRPEDRGSRGGPAERRRSHEWFVVRLPESGRLGTRSVPWENVRARHSRTPRNRAGANAAGQWRRRKTAPPIVEGQREAFHKWLPTNFKGDRR